MSLNYFCRAPDIVAVTAIVNVFIYDTMLMKESLRLPDNVTTQPQLNFGLESNQLNNIDR